MLLAVGPSIRGCCYEVGDEVIEAVTGQSAQIGHFDFVRRYNGRSKLDLSEANAAQASELGVRTGNIEVYSDCTYCEAERFYSYRRQGPGAGRQGAFIGRIT